ncbi:hypothetical protein Thermus77412_24460 [Thermus antranikianii]
MGGVYTKAPQTIYGFTADFPRTLGRVIRQANPQQLADSLSQGLEPHPNLRYHQVVLGARRSGGSMRWLTHQEISAGVLQTIEAGLAQWMVGDGGPW